MKRSLRLYSLALLTLLAILTVSLIGHIPQAASYHHFCDTRPLWGIPDFANTVSNLPFLAIGIAGLLKLRQTHTPGPKGVIPPVGVKPPVRIKPPADVKPAVRIIAPISATGPIGASYFFLFIGIFFTGIGSAYYHLSPNNDTLVFDRLPMTIVFMSLLAAVTGESIGPRAAALALPPLLLAGAGSIWWWHYSQNAGNEDLRPYILVQYYPIVLIPLILLLFPTPAGKRGWPPLLFAIAWYALAKLLEQLDCTIYSIGGAISGHTLKHLAAAVSTWLLLKRFTLIHTAHQ